MEKRGKRQRKSSEGRKKGRERHWCRGAGESPFKTLSRRKELPCGERKDPRRMPEKKK